MSPGQRSGSELIVRRSRENEVYLLVAMVLNAVTALINAQSDHGRYGTAERAVSAVSFALALVVASQVIRSGPRFAPLLVIGSTGLTVPGPDLVPWADLASVRVTRTRWGTVRAVAFVPGPAGRCPRSAPSGSGTCRVAVGPAGPLPATAAPWWSCPAG